MKRKEKYESPFMERTLVELEDGFCAASVVSANSNEVKTTGHQLNDFDFTDDAYKDWNSPEGDNYNGWK